MTRIRNRLLVTLVLVAVGLAFVAGNARAASSTGTLVGGGFESRATAPFCTGDPDDGQGIKDPSTVRKNAHYVGGWGRGGLTELWLRYWAMRIWATRITGTAL